MVSPHTTEPRRLGTASSGTGLTSANRHPKLFFDSDLVAIQIEDTLFNVHKHLLMKSTTFSDMFSIADESKDKQTSQEGSSPDNPIVMEGVSASDFADLMTVLYTNHFLEDRRRPELTPPQISTVFRLADMWNFEELRAYLKPLAETILGDADKIALAREANVTEWLAPAHARLCLREKKIATQEASKLGLNSLLFISRFREDNPRKAIGTSYCVNCSRQHSCRSCPGFHSSRVECTQPQESEVMRKVQTWLKRGWGLLD